MTFQELASARYSVRAFQNTPVVFKYTNTLFVSPTMPKTIINFESILS